MESANISMPPRSTGCRTCVKRKIKCDETHPFCKRCQKSDRNCPGFREGLVFIHESSETLKNLPYLRIRQDPPASGPSAPRRAEPWLEVELGLSAFSDDMYLAHLLERFVAIGAQYPDYVGNGTWMKVCLSNQGAHPTATSALKCLATSFFGRRHHQEMIVIKAARSYGQTLSDLAQTLQNMDGDWNFDALATITALNYYEFLTYTTCQGWIQHSQGLAKLIEMSGAHRFQQYPCRCILNVNRPTLIAHALAARRRTFLEGEDWKSVSLSIDPTLTHMLDLDSLFAKLPGIAETITAFGGSSVDLTTVADEFEETRIKLSTLREELDRWYTTWTQDLGHSAREVGAEPDEGITHDAQGLLFDTLLEFEDVTTAKTFIHYNGIKIAALEWQHKLFNLSWQRGPDHEGMTAIPEANECALNVCRSIGYLLRPVHALSGSFYLLIPARIACLGLPRLGREAQWLAHILEMVADQNGLECARNMLRVPIIPKL